jgi:hypothetical protein
MDINLIKTKINQRKDMIITGKKYDSKPFEPCPDYTGTAQIVDVTEPRDYETSFGTKSCIKFVLEVDKLKEVDGKKTKERWVCFTRPMSLSLHPKAGLRKFLDSLRPAKLTDAEIETGIEMEDYVGTFVNVVVRQEAAEGSDQKYANVKFIEPCPEDVQTWESSWVRLQDRPQKDASVSKKK